jgi:hypothetical protein
MRANQTNLDSGELVYHIAVMYVECGTLYEVFMLLTRIRVWCSCVLNVDMDVNVILGSVEDELGGEYNGWIRCTGIVYDYGCTKTSDA